MYKNKISISQKRVSGAGFLDSCREVVGKMMKRLHIR